MFDVCVVGLGAIGTFYACALERTGKVRVTAVCRSNFDILSQRGVELVSDRLGTNVWKPHRAVRNPAEAADRRYRFVICAVKALPDVLPTSKLLAPLLSSADTFVLVQNGIDIHKDLQDAQPDAEIISSCAWSDATTVDGGRRVVQAGPDGLTSGVHWSSSNKNATEEKGAESLQLLHDLLSQGGVQSEITDDISAARWRKVLWNAVISTLCTVTQSPVADILSSDQLPTMLPVVEAVMAEVVSVARGMGIDASKLPEQSATSVIEGCMNQYSDTRSPNPSRFKPSMLVDLEAGRPMEVEPIVGNVVRAARSCGVAVPRLEMLYAQLKVMQRRLLRTGE
ncbi:6-phosphogluconate dehydrogenase C-terminal domain-like protein [Amylostereum chailletii]|nr:6-phosphogluconate dehydrogenase C-terminal domain-like protein [Amylostereum chailletii]